VHAHPIRPAGQDEERGQIAKKIDPGTWWPPFEPPLDSIPSEAEGGNIKGVAGADTGGSPNGVAAMNRPSWGKEGTHEKVRFWYRPFGVFSNAVSSGLRCGIFHADYVKKYEGTASCAATCHEGAAKEVAESLHYQQRAVRSFLMAGMQASSQE